MHDQHQYPHHDNHSYPVELELARSTNTNRELNGLFTLRVIDSNSDQVIADVELNSAQFANLMSNSRAYGHGQLFPDAADRWGKIMQSESRPVPDEHGRNDATAQSWADEYARTNGWSHARVRARSTGFAATFRRWKEADQ